MANGLYYGLNQGALLRKLFPKQLNTQVLILIWTVIFFINFAIIILVQNTLIYPIAGLSKEDVAKVPYFKGCTVTAVHGVPKVSAVSADNYGYYAKYVDENGDIRVVCMDVFPRKMFDRYRLLKSTDVPVLANGMVEYTDQNGTKEISIEEYACVANTIGFLELQLMMSGSRHLVGIYVFFGVGMLLIEFLIYSVFHRLFRE